jgi:hypothetical protein
MVWLMILIKLLRVWPVIPLKTALWLDVKMAVLFIGKFVEIHENKQKSVKCMSNKKWK